MRRLGQIGVVLAAMIASPCFAQSGDPLIEGAKLCTRHLPRYEREFGIPTHLLSAIASTESGRYHTGLKINVPWPWTINAEGKGYYFDTKEQAVAAAKKLRLRGVTSMDVGCMQVNLYHHPDAFVSLDQAFDPEKNIAYAAGFLRNLYQGSSSWKQAAADYHSKTPSLGGQYVGVVYNSWYKIVDKLRAARLQSGGERPLQVASVATAPVVAEKPAPVREPNRDYVEVTPVVSTDASQDTTYIKHVKPTIVQVISPAPLPEQKGRKVAAYQSPRMNSISVSTRKDNGIMVVRPPISVVDEAQPIKVAQVHNSITAAAPSAVPAVATTTKKTGPNFIFND